MSNFSSQKGAIHGSKIVLQRTSALHTLLRGTLPSTKYSVHYIQPKVPHTRQRTAHDITLHHTTHDISTSISLHPIPSHFMLFHFIPSHLTSSYPIPLQSHTLTWLSWSSANIDDEEVDRRLGWPDHVIPWGNHLYWRATQLRPARGKIG